MGVVVGIDLGTTYSAIASVNKYGRAELIPIFEGGELLPSVVLLDDPPLVGIHAKNSAVGRPLDTVQFVKRHMGEPTWRQRSDSGKEYSPEDISALLLKRLKEDAEAHLGESVESAVISVPAYFDDACRRATQDAGQIAGLDVLRIVNEPTAAALAYGVDTRASGTVLVYDLGGGTFDVTIMQSDGQDLEVLATNGDRALGGFDWDNLLMEWLDDEFVRRGAPSHLDAPETEQDLRVKAELLKRTLSGRDRASASLSVGGVSHTIEIRREQFEELTRPLLARTERILTYVLEEAAIGLSGIDRVLLVGGSTRMPAVPALIERITGRRPSPDIHPDKAVALGAAILGNLSGNPNSVLPVRDATGSLVATRVSDVTSHSLGVATVRTQGYDSALVNTIVLPKGTKVPAGASQVLCTVEHGQDVWHAQITEGEDEDLEYVRIVGDGVLEIPRYHAGAYFEVGFAYDRDGIIHVSLKDVQTGYPVGQMRIERRANLSEDEVRRRAHAMEYVHPR